MKSIAKKLASKAAVAIILSSCSTALAEDKKPEEGKKGNAEAVEVLKNATVAFRKSLSETLLEKCSNKIDNKRFYLWHNTPANARGKRDGITYGDLDEKQLIAFKAILQKFLSEDGYQKVYEITELSEGWLKEVKSDVWNPDFYSIDMFGDPEIDDSWGFQLDGHHCVVNFLVQGNNVSIVPAFLGAEPAKQNYQGKDFDIFKDERELGLDYYSSLNAEEKKKAITKSPERALKVGPAKRSGEPDPFIGDYDYSIFKKGLKFSEMTEVSKKKISLLMKEYVYNMSRDFADVWWSDIEVNMDDTYFVWIDNVEQASSTSQFYYRIYNPYLWVEFNTENITGRNKETMEPWNHVHSITRIPNNPVTKNGGDYGRFAKVLNSGSPLTLLDHYVNADHHHDSIELFDYKVEMTAHSHEH